MKSFKVYQELEERHAQAIGMVADLSDQLLRKDRVIRALAAELAAAYDVPGAEASEEVSTILAELVQDDAGSTRPQSTEPHGTQQQQPQETPRKPSLRRASVPLSELMSEVRAPKRTISAVLTRPSAHIQTSKKETK